MKKPKILKRHCPYCKKHTEQKVAQNKSKGRNATHPLSVGSKKRVRARGERRGTGNLGRYSKPPKPKRTGKKLSKKTDFRYNCSVCKKTKAQSSGIRAKKVELI
ncbi:50S ribosomal protein L44e [Candidatus Woesearchaeota archaeon]|nr:50S ribosomal protein L44e [Candidatus Woesearchaeota archaeon]|tara:strand:+ start:65 stop:376 length:312 start_codon:yes stop_codon:yes gene_type:complete